MQGELSPVHLEGLGPVYRERYALAAERQTVASAAVDHRLSRISGREGLSKGD